MSGWVVLAAAVIAVMALVATSLLMRPLAAPASHVSRPRAGRVLRRQATLVLALAVTTALMCAACGLMANRTMGFVHSPSELVGIVKNALRSGETNVSTLIPPQQSGNSHATQPPALRYDEEQKVWRATLAGTHSGLTREIAVWAPDGYAPVGADQEDGQDGDAPQSDRQPLARAVVLYHGYPGTAIGTVQALELTKRIAPLIEQGVIPPTLLVFPDLSLDGAEPDCIDIAGRPRTETFIVNDLVPAMRAAFPSLSGNADDWAIGGFSAGAYCAPVMHVRHRDVFGAALAMGGYDTPQLGALKNADPQTQEEFTLSHLLKEPHEKARRVLTIGVYSDGDAVTLGNALEHLASEQPDDAFVSVLKAEGSHGWTTWREDLPTALKWWSGKETRSETPRAIPWWQLTEPAPLIGSAAAWGIAMMVSIMRVCMRSHPRGVRRGVTDFLIASLTCLFGALLVLLIVNHSGTFFYSWGDLWTNVVSFFH